MGMITPVPENPHPLDTAAALKLIDMSLADARRQATYWGRRVAELEAARDEWKSR